MHLGSIACRSLIRLADLPAWSYPLKLGPNGASLSPYAYPRLNEAHPTFRPYFGQKIVQHSSSRRAKIPPFARFSSADNPGITLPDVCLPIRRTYVKIALTSPSHELLLPALICLISAYKSVLFVANSFKTTFIALFTYTYR